MKNIYSLDACSLFALFNNESGADEVETVLTEALRDNAEVYMNKINLYEVYYGYYRDSEKHKADEVYNLIKAMPISITETFTDDIFTEAARLKTQYKMSLADSIALGEAIIRRAQLVTADHHEFDPVAKKENVKIYWIR
ncbi:MAG: PIN domain-containing protein [Clostridia bacterium]|jgi:predicted nucleic acid-binding protein|nr:PIN domain-containing protein [Clostridia bacterium]